MKAKMLKIAGVKSEAAFYKKFPNQEAFMKVHGKEFKKAQMSNSIDKAQTGFTQGFGMNPQSQYQNTFSPNNNFVPGNYNVSTPNINPMSGFQNADPFAMQNYGQQFANQNPLPQQGTGQISNSVFGENKALTGGLGGKDYSAKGSGISNQAIASSISSIPGIFNAFAAQKKQKQSLEQQNKLLGLFETLSQSTDVNAPYQKNILDSPENYAQSTNMFYPSQGTGYDILRGVGRDGATIRKAQDGINNFGPDYDLYSDNIKQYANGGVTGNPIYGAASGVIGNEFNNSAGYQAGAAVAPYADMILPGSGLALQMLGGGLDQAFGDAGDINNLTRQNTGIEDRIKKNSMWRNPQYSANMQEGGYMNPEYNPQLITMFGDHDSEDFADYAHKYRSGGHLKDDKYTPVSNKGLEIYAEGGELKTHWGGEVEPVSYNPYSEGTGLTYNAYGNSHFEKDGQGRTGIGLEVLQNGGTSTGEADIEMEKGEPIVGNVIYGNLNVNEDLLKDFQLPEKYAKQKVKNVVNKMIVPLEQKYTAQLENIVIDNSSDNSKFGPLEKKTKEIKKLGLNMKLKKLAEDKENLAAYQDHVHKTTDFLTNLLGKEVSQEKFAKNGEVSHTLAKGEISQAARNGKTIKAQAGTYSTKGTLPGSIDYNIPDVAEDIFKGSNYETQWGTKRDKAFSDPTIAKQLITDIENYSGQDAEDVKTTLAKEKTMSGKIAKAYELASDKKVGPYHTILNSIIDKNTKPEAAITSVPTSTANTTDDTTELEPIEETKKGFPWLGAATSLIRGMQPAFNMPLGNQINPELYALANNRVKGFAVNKTYDMLKTPAKYSADKDRNAVLSQAREAVKNSGNNPAAQSAIMASVADAMNQIGSKEQEINQQGYQGVYNDNIATVNQNKNRNAALDMDAQLKMLQAESNTDARTLSALTSLYGKEAANKRENIEYNVGMAEHPDFTFGPDGRIIKLPRYIDFDTSGKNATASSSKKQTAPEGFEYLYDSSGNVKTMKSKKEDGVARDGKTIKKKNINGNIVKAFKNL
jgi:hypothetical protein